MLFTSRVSRNILCTLLLAIVRSTIADVSELPGFEYKESSDAVIDQYASNLAPFSAYPVDFDASPISPQIITADHDSDSERAALANENVVAIKPKVRYDDERLRSSTARPEELRDSFSSTFRPDTISGIGSQISTVKPVVVAQPNRQYQTYQGASQYVRPAQSPVYSTGGYQSQRPIASSTVRPQSNIGAYQTNNQRPAVKYSTVRPQSNVGAYQSNYQRPVVSYPTTVRPNPVRYQSQTAQSIRPQVVRPQPTAYNKPQVKPALNQNRYQSNQVYKPAVTIVKPQSIFGSSPTGLASNDGLTQARFQPVPVTTTLTPQLAYNVGDYSPALSSRPRVQSNQQSDQYKHQKQSNDGSLKSASKYGSSASATEEQQREDVHGDSVELAPGYNALSLGYGPDYPLGLPNFGAFDAISGYGQSLFARPQVVLPSVSPIVSTHQPTIIGSTSTSRPFVGSSTGLGFFSTYSPLQSNIIRLAAPSASLATGYGPSNLFAPSTFGYGLSSTSLPFLDTSSTSTTTPYPITTSTRPVSPV